MMRCEALRSIFSKETPSASRGTRNALTWLSAASRAKVHSTSAWNAPPIQRLAPLMVHVPSSFCEAVSLEFHRQHLSRDLARSVQKRRAVRSSRFLDRVLRPVLTTALFHNRSKQAGLRVEEGGDVRVATSPSSKVRMDSKTPRTDSPASSSAGGFIKRRDCSGSIISSGRRSSCHASLRYGYTLSVSVVRSSSSTVFSAAVKRSEKP